MAASWPVKAAIMRFGRIRRTTKWRRFLGHREIKEGTSGPLVDNSKFQSPEPVTTVNNQNFRHRSPVSDFFWFLESSIRDVVKTGRRATRAQMADKFFQKHRQLPKTTSDINPIVNRPAKAKSFRQK